MKRLLTIGMIAVAAVFVALFASWAQMRHEEFVCGDNLKYIGMAIANYHDTYRRFPSPDADGHSWRIRIVPYLFASAMYEPKGSGLLDATERI
jgi:hypothetical protein